jgi:uncharacterized Zn finger protein
MFESDCIKCGKKAKTEIFVVAEGEAAKVQCENCGHVSVRQFVRTERDAPPGFIYVYEND